MKNTLKCFDCGKPVSRKGIKRCINCWHIYHIGKHTSFYIDGRNSKKYFCKDCGKSITRSCALYGKKRCKSCARKVQFLSGKINYTRENHPQWKGGKRIASDGYVHIYLPTHPYALSNGYIREHRVVMETKLGRYLTKEEIVHHLNGIKSDNRPENLVLTNNKTHDTWTLVHLSQIRIKELENKLNEK